MSSKIKKCLKEQEGNYIFPFFWLHGESEEVLRKYMQVIHEANIKAVCVESRPHPDFCGPKWWKDMDIILDEARKRDMKVWILDDSHFPTGYANGEMKNQPDHKCRQSIVVQVRTVNPGESCVIVKENLKTAASSEYRGLELIYGREERRVFTDDCLLGIVCAKKQENGRYDFLNPVVFQGEEILEKEADFVFDAKEDSWKIYLIQLTRNRGPHRDYINMMDETSCKVLLEAVYEPHWEHYKAEFGKTIAGFFSDEPELGNGHLYAQDTILGKDFELDFPWSEELEKEFRNWAGDSALRRLPLLWENDADAGIIARVRYQYMNLVTRLVEKDFSCQIGEWCRAHGVKYIGHLIEDNNMHARTGCSLGHYFRGLAGQDMSGIDCIGGQVVPFGEEEMRTGLSYNNRLGEFYHYMLGKLANSLAALSPDKKGNAMCEIFGAYGWAEGVKLEKYLVDHFLVRGINHFVPHAFSPKVFPDPDCPPHFYAHGHNPQYRHFAALMRYTNRVCELLSEGRHVAVAAILYHGEAEWAGKCMMSHEIAHILCDHQIEYDFVPQDVFEEKKKWELSIENRFLQIHKQKYSVVIIPYMQFIRKEFARAIKELCMKKVPVYFIQDYPEGICDLDYAELASESELLSNLAEAKVIAKEDLLNVLISEHKREIVLQPSDNRIRYYHYVHEDETEIFLFINEGKEAWEGIVEIEDKDRSTVWNVYEYDAWCNQTFIVDQLDTGSWNLVIEPRKSKIIICDKEEIPVLQGKGMSIRKTLRKQEKEFSAKWKRSLCTGIQYPQFSEEKEIAIPDTLAEERKEFSGVIRYRNHFTFPCEEHLFLLITEAFEGVEVFLNKKSLGIQVSAPFWYDLGNTDEEYDAEICIEVATTLEREMAAWLEQNGEKTETPQCGSGITGEIKLIVAS